MHMSAIMDRGIVRLRASVPISDEVRKQPLKDNKIITIIQFNDNK